ncbi:serine aminopeptidase domain-containing protein [Cupriavidus basilensis]|uniref:serine aminopeptidase domain-containing protein n=1 Tax=Cupriavidus basilensis TaxID=68895 RepID=UPI000ACA8AFF|nr:alpha/beta hydrolase [Cupriavidus basilensis]
MRPLHFDGCFGWYHAATGARAVVLCNAVGHEALWTHAGLARLAERLAAQGVPVLRFDYPGTGDSADAVAAADRVEDGAGAPANCVDACVASIGQAGNLLRRLSGAREIVLLGVRGGAALAALAAARRAGGLDVAGLALLAPVASGRMLMREMRMIAQTWRSLAGRAVTAAADAAPVSAPAGADILGIHFTAADLEAFSRIDLCAAASAPAPRVFIAGAGPDEALPRHYAALGAQVSTVPFPEVVGWLQDPLHGTPPDATFAAVAGWLAGMAPAAGRAEARAGEGIGAAGVAPCLRAAAWVETPVRFGQGLFGMLCEPRGEWPGRPAVLINNAGGTHHVGAGRGGVMLARRLAERGVASLRIDVRGIGDASIGAQAIKDAVPADPEGYLDAIAACDWLQARGYGEVVVFGVSYGANVGLHAAGAHPGVVGAVLVNLQRLLRRETFTRPRWLIHGRSAPTAEEGVPGTDAASVLPRPAPAEQQEIEALLRKLEARGTVLRLLFGPEDPGPYELARFFGPRLEGLAGFGMLQIETIEGLDHGMLNPPGRARVIGYCVDLLSGALHPGADLPARLRRAAQPWRGMPGCRGRCG